MSEVTKTQEKKAIKRERIQAKYRREKEEKKAKRASSELVEKNESEPSFIVDGIRAIRQERNAMFRADFEAKCDHGPVVVIDCEWGDKMTSKELLSLTQQIMYSYSTVKRSEKPVRLWIVGVSEEQATLLRNLPGLDTWNVVLTTQSLEQLNLAESAVYLTADSADVIDVQHIDANSTLIIGGIVDRNRHKNCTLDKAKLLGMKTAQLPIGEFMPLKSSKVLTVNHVVHILTEVLTHKSWKRALDTVIPDRKRGRE